jgi:diguanylate cyclase (GGDEF)-like protein
VSPAHQSQLSLEDVAATGDSSADEAVWVESERGKPFQAAPRDRSARAIEAVFGRAFANGVPTDAEWRDAIHPDERQQAVAALAAGRAGAPYDVIYRAVAAGGGERRIRDRLHPVADRWLLRIVNVLPVQAVGFGLPAEGLAAALDDAVLFIDHAGSIVATMGQSAALPDTPASLLGRRVADLDELPVAARHAWTRALERSLDTQRPQIVAYERDRGDGARPFEARIVPTREGAVVVIRDVGERNRLRERVDHLATHDPTTGLGNVRALRDRLAQWLPPGGPATGIGAVALMVVDLDRFKQANDLLGRSLGDGILRVVAQRLAREAEQAAIGSGDPDAVLATRLGGDQFAIAWRLGTTVRTDSGAAVRSFAERLLTTLAAPTRIAGQTLFVRASIGAALAPDDARDATTLLSQAEGALRRAKLAGRNQFRRHGDDARTAPVTAPIDERALRAALAAQDFHLVYQPKFSLAASAPHAYDVIPVAAGTLAESFVGIEALLRWRRPGGTVLAPEEFLPLAEAVDAMRPLGDWVLHTALAETAELIRSFDRRIGLCVNLSLMQLHDRTFVETVATALARHGFAPHELTFEIAETALRDDVRLVADVVAELSALGVRIAVDNFGAGTGGLMALKSLPIDEIKIDRAFIAGAAIDAFDATIVSGLVEMAHNLGKLVTADGVERVDQIAALSQMRCDSIQGFFIGEPLPARELATMESLRHLARPRSRSDP